MSILEREAPDLTADSVRRLVDACSRVHGAASEIIAMVGRNEPISTVAQLRLTGAHDDVLDAVAVYQPTVLATVVALSAAVDLEQYRRPDGTVSHVHEHVRQVVVGDWVQAEHGDEGNWERVDEAPIHAETQTGLPTRNLAGEVRLRWWGNEDTVRVAERPVPDPAAWRAEAGR